MKKILSLATIILIAVTIPAYAIGTHIGTYFEGAKPCVILCFDIIKNADTKGYDPQFLKMEKVKTTCQDAINDGVKLGYCDKSLGTL